MKRKIERREGLPLAASPIRHGYVTVVKLTPRDACHAWDWSSTVLFRRRQRRRQRQRESFSRPEYERAHARKLWDISLCEWQVDGEKLCILSSSGLGKVFFLWCDVELVHAVAWLTSTCECIRETKSCHFLTEKLANITETVEYLSLVPVAWFTYKSIGEWYLLRLLHRNLWRSRSNDLAKFHYHIIWFLGRSQKKMSGIFGRITLVIAVAYNTKNFSRFILPRCKNLDLR